MKTPQKQMIRPKQGKLSRLGMYKTEAEAIKRGLRFPV